MAGLGNPLNLRKNEKGQPMKLFKSKAEKRQIKIEKLQRNIKNLECKIAGWDRMLRWVKELPMARLDEYRYDVASLERLRSELAELLRQ
jgi:hypothetical protein